MFFTVPELFLLNGLIVICHCLSKTVRNNDTVKFTYFLVMRLSITIFKSCGLLIVILGTLFFIFKPGKFSEETRSKRCLKWFYQIACIFQLFTVCDSISKPFIRWRLNLGCVMEYWMLLCNYIILIIYDCILFHWLLCIIFILHLPSFQLITVLCCHKTLGIDKSHSLTHVLFYNAFFANSDHRILLSDTKKKLENQED